MSRRQSLLSRMFFFAAGGFLSVGINWGIYRLMQDVFGAPRWSALALSLLVVTAVFSVWNYFLNFRTRLGWRESLVRYLGAIGFCYGLNYGIALTGIKHLAHTRLVEFSVLASVQVLVSGVKFLLYHRWVYPRHDS